MIAVRCNSSEAHGFGRRLLGGVGLVTFVTLFIPTTGAALLPPSAEAAWAELAYDKAGFDEIVAIAREVHLTGKIPASAWVKSANGALRVLRPKVRLTARTLLTATARRTLLDGDISRLKCLDSRIVLLAVKPRQRPDSTAALRRLRAARRAKRAAERKAFTSLPFGAKGLACVMAEVERRLPTVTGLPSEATVTRIQRRRAWRLATNHLLKGMDPHAVIIPNKLLEQLDDESGGERRVGVGVEVAVQQGAARLVRIHKGGPAAKAGLRPGDQLLKLGDAPIKGWTANRIDRALGGKSGSKLTLTVRRRRRTWALTLVRAAVRRSTVTGRRHGPRGEVAVVSLPVFASGAAPDLVELLTQLRAASRQRPKAMVLDLRGNTGGWVNEAVAIADRFLARGEIVRVKQRGEPDTVHNAKRSKSDERLPLVVLVDSACRSSCELLTDALQAHGRAVVLGAPTYGKGTVQGVFEAERGKWSLLITIARYHGPDGGSVQARGVTPDLNLAGVKRGGFREVNYSGALSTVRGDRRLRKGPSAHTSKALAACLKRAHSKTMPWLATIERADYALSEAIRMAMQCRLRPMQPPKKRR